VTTINDLINLLGTEHTPVKVLWKRLGITRKAFTTLCETHRNYLATAGIQLHSAVHSQTSNTALSVMIEGTYIQALSRPESGVVAYIAKYLDTMYATPAELTRIRTKIDQLAGQLATSDQAEPSPHQADDQAEPHVTYRQEYIRCGKPTCRKCNGDLDSPGHGPYWYGYTTIAGKTKKKYVGKERPS
jgi:hypothetical protein